MSAKSMLPAPIAAFVSGIAPMRVVSTVMPVVAGVATGEIGGAALKMITPIEDFASGGPPQDALVHVAGGTVLNAAVTAGYFLATKNAGGAGKIAALMTVGTLVTGAQPFIAPAIAKVVDAVTTALAGVLKKTPAIAPSSTQAPAGLADFNPAGLADFTPGGADPYGGSAWGTH